VSHHGKEERVDGNDSCNALSLCFVADQFGDLPDRDVTVPVEARPHWFDQLACCRVVCHLDDAVADSHGDQSVGDGWGHPFEDDHWQEEGTWAKLMFGQVGEDVGIV
jgi:hypothetical protein